MIRFKCDRCGQHYDKAEYVSYHGADVTDTDPESKGEMTTCAWTGHLCESCFTDILRYIKQAPDLAG